MAAQDCQKTTIKPNSYMSGDNKLAFDPPTHFTELTLNLIRLSRYVVTTRLP